MFGHRFRNFVLLAPFLFILLGGGCNRVVSQMSGPPILLTVPSKPDGLPVLEDPAPDGSLPHDTDSFTQGLLYAEGYLFESRGRYKQSQLKKIDPKDGTVVKKADIAPQYFAEGLAYAEGSLYQLSWRAGICLIHNLDLEPEGELMYGREGWGLCTVPEKDLFAFSDGTPYLRMISRENFISQKKLTVKDGNGTELPRLNELEWVNGEIWANVWTSDTIARIDPESGKVVGWLKFNELTLEQQGSTEDVLNGIAYDPETDRLWITGKLWSKIYYFDNVKERFFTPPDKPRTGTPSPAR